MHKLTSAVFVWHQDKMQTMRELLHNISRSLLDTADLITQAMSECEPSSPGSSRPSSIGTPPATVASSLPANSTAAAADVALASTVAAADATNVAAVNSAGGKSIHQYVVCISN